MNFQKDEVPNQDIVSERLPDELTPKIAQDFRRILCGLQPAATYQDNGTYVLEYDPSVHTQAFIRMNVKHPSTPMPEVYFVASDKDGIRYRGFPTGVLNDHGYGLPDDFRETTDDIAFRTIKEATNIILPGDKIDIKSPEYKVGSHIADTLWSRHPYACLVEPHTQRQWSITTDCDLVVSQYVDIEGFGACIMQTIRTYDNDSIHEQHRVLSPAGEVMDDFFERLTPAQQMKAALWSLERQGTGEDEDRPPNLESFSGTDRGERENNEDASIDVCGIWHTAGWYAIADGMGGHENGRAASDTAISTTTTEVARRLLEYGFRQKIPTDKEIEIIQEQSFNLAHRALQATEDNRGTTLTVALVINGKVHMAHIGDSRAYVIGQGIITQMTEDHTWYAKAVRRKDPFAGETSDHILYQSLGMEEDLDIQMVHTALESGDQLLLAVDGFYYHLGDDGILKALDKSREEFFIQNKVSAMLEAALEAGSLDNVTFVHVRAD